MFEIENQYSSNSNDNHMPNLNFSSFPIFDYQSHINEILFDTSLSNLDNFDEDLDPNRISINSRSNAFQIVHQEDFEITSQLREIMEAYNQSIHEAEEVSNSLQNQINEMANKIDGYGNAHIKSMKRLREVQEENIHLKEILQNQKEQVPIKDFQNIQHENELLLERIKTQGVIIQELRNIIKDTSLQEIKDQRNFFTLNNSLEELANLRTKVAAQNSKMKKKVTVFKLMAQMDELQNTVDSLKLELSAKSEENEKLKKRILEMQTMINKNGSDEEQIETGDLMKCE